MDAKERTKMGYDLFNKGDMETFFKEMVDENTTWTFPGKEGVHPLSGVHKGPQAMMAAMGKIPTLWSNFHLTPIDMIAEEIKFLSELRQLQMAWIRCLVIILKLEKMEKC